jgi:predicted amidophosphoribosyltransferase
LLDDVQPTQVILDKYDEVADDLAKLKDHAYCGVCGRVSSDKKYCLHCGAEIKASALASPTAAPTAPSEGSEREDSCPACKADLQPSDTYCPKCGTTLK